MKIKELFERPIDREINGVVKADQLDSASVWQELDEFVVTKELVSHINELVDVLLSTMESDTNPGNKNGIWISGHFGCGKSHLLKVLSYLLENNEHEYRSEKKRAVEFFKEKITDAALYADLKKVTSNPTETILFNISTKADLTDGPEALLLVFLKVLNEHQGYSPDHPHIAHMERHLHANGKLQAFHDAFQSAAKAPWIEERDSWMFHRDEVREALSNTLGQSHESVEAWIEGGENNFSLTIENFAKWVTEYLNSKGPKHRIMFLVDEVGQFISQDTSLMLSLQTITEQLGTLCGGRAWVVVTSQEDLEAALGELVKGKKYDFSKIQGRFKTRLSLSSANVDEVIKTRLLQKSPHALAAISNAYDGKQDILKNQLAFVDAGMTFQSYNDVADFSDCYPFAAYQFALVQKVFESISKVGATGVHLAKGERSTLDAFQNATKQIMDEEVDVLVPFYRFYTTVEEYLEGALKSTITGASEHHALKPFDATLLKLLFLIRYIDELPGSVDNLVTLCIDKIDADRHSLRKQIEDSLARLESETLISRNGALYFFLTNEERDIGREIKNTPIASSAEEREIGKLIFEDIFGDDRKHTFLLNGRVFSFNRICDDHPVGNRIEDDLEVSVISPVGDDFDRFADDSHATMMASQNDSRLFIRLPDDPNLGKELRKHIQTDSYIKTKPTSGMAANTGKILRDLSDENRLSRKRLVAALRELLERADYFANGQKLNISSTDPKKALSDGLHDLIENSFSKMGYIEHSHPNPKQEIQSTLRSDDIDQLTLTMETQESNPRAIEDLREYLSLCKQTSKRVVLYELIDKRYGNRPFGWHELEVVLLVARLAVLREIDLLVDSQPLPLERAYEHLVTSRNQRKVTISLRESAASDLIKSSQVLGRTLFAQQGPDKEEALFAHLQQHLCSWNTDVQNYENLAKTGEYPGFEDIQRCIADLRKFVAEPNSVRFLKRFVENKDDLLEIKDHIDDLKGFYTSQKPTWEKLTSAVKDLELNRLQIEQHTEAHNALMHMKKILKTPHPYHLLKDAEEWIATTRSVNDQLLAEAREQASTQIDHLSKQISDDLDKISANADLQEKTVGPLNKLLSELPHQTSIAHIHQIINTANLKYDQALLFIEKSQIPTAAPSSESSESGKDSADTVPTTTTTQIKIRRVVEPRVLCSGTFIETAEQMEDFLSRLRSKMEAALQANERIQIQ